MFVGVSFDQLWKYTQFSLSCYEIEMKKKKIAVAITHDRIIALFKKLKSAKG